MRPVCAAFGRVHRSARALAGTAAGALVLWALAAAPLAAQGEWTPSTAPWKDSFYPYFPSLGNNFPLIALHFEERKAADYFARTPYAGLFSVDAGLGFTGARMLVTRLQAPLLVKDWRLAATAGASRESRMGYYGLGNDTEYDSDLENDQQPHWYRASRTRYFGSAEISRRLVGPLYLAAQGGVERSVLKDLSKPSLFRNDFGTSDEVDTDVRGRLSLVLDARDNEFNTSRGVYAMAAIGGGSGGDGYNRVTADVRGYLPLREGTVVALRLAGSSLSEDAPLHARFEMPSWESDIPVYGGAYSNRGLVFQRLIGRGVLVGSAEVRHDLLNLGDLGAFTLIAFADAGRVFEQTDFKLTTEDLKVGAGGGLAIRLMRFTIWTFNFAGGPDGFNFTAGSGWSF